MWKHAVFLALLVCYFPSWAPVIGFFALLYMGITISYPTFAPDLIFGSNTKHPLLCGWVSLSLRFLFDSPSFFVWCMMTLRREFFYMVARVSAWDGCMHRFHHHFFKENHQKSRKSQEVFSLASCWCCRTALLLSSSNFQSAFVSCST